jgi:hypothetical protein
MSYVSAIYSEDIRQPVNTFTQWELILSINLIFGKLGDIFCRI